jgi:hypothetical protein
LTLSKNTEISDFIKILSVEPEFYADGQIGMNKETVALRYFANLPERKIVCLGTLVPS